VTRFLRYLLLSCLLLPFGGPAFAQAGDSSSLFRDTGLGDQWLKQIFHSGGDSARGASSLLGQMLQIYNLGILAVASLMLVVVIVTMVMESAQVGRVGGERHNPAWAVVRLVMAIGLLTPLVDGYNGAQLGAIQLAHAGSGLANALWAKFTPAQLDNNFRATAVIGENPSRFLEQVVVSETCLAGVVLDRRLPGDQDYGSVTAQALYRDAANTSKETQGELIPMSVNGAQDGIEYLTIPDRLHVEAQQKQLPVSRFRIHYNRIGNDDYCGALEIPAPLLSSPAASDDATLYLQALLKIRHIMAGYASSIVVKVDAIAAAAKPGPPTATTAQTVGTIGGMTLPNMPVPQSPAAQPAAPLPELPQVELEAAAWNELAERFARQLSIAAQKVAQDYVNPELQASASDNQGWGEAGFVFFRVARLSHDNLQAQNYSFSAVLPNDVILPATMRSGGVPASCAPLLKGAFRPDYNCLSEGQETTLSIKVADSVLDNVNSQNGEDPLVIADSSNGVERRQNQLTAELTRRGHLDSFLDQISGRGGAQETMPIIGAINGGNEMLRSASVFLRDSSSASGNGSTSLILIIFAGISYVVGFFLAYCLPLFPLIRFFSGILSWLLTLFEALVALPLVALVSLRGDGDGLFAHSEQGILLLLQMVLRPVLMIIGLIAALTVFNMLYMFINQAIWHVFFGVSSSAGTGSLDNVLGFYACLLLWTFLVYSLANLSFGMINTIPNRVLVWVGEKKVQVLPGKAPEERLQRPVEAMVQAAPQPVGQPLAPPPATVTLAPGGQANVTLAQGGNIPSPGQKSLSSPAEKPKGGDHAKHIPKV
jgi:conjugal transfer/type IV secretion protein DotA/TraY